jgi:glycosyltransferase involved in cell wall biosynthesis
VNIAVIVATYGSPEWDVRGDRAAGLLHVSQATDATYRTHLDYGTLAQSRNYAAARALQDDPDAWLCFVDADDELAPGYLAAMRAAERDPRSLLVPRIQYVRGRRVDEPKYPAMRPGADEHSLEDGNWCVIGTLIHGSLFREVGGFEEWPMYEDWALWARAWKAGAQLVRVPEAVYVAHVNPRGRNHEGGRNAKVAAHAAIKRAVFPELCKEAT